MTNEPTPIRIDLPMDQIRAFCRRWKVSELALFGSVLREDFRPDSDVDVLVTLYPNHGFGLYEIMDMEEELKTILNRHIDLVLPGGLRNPFRRQTIMNSKRVIYAA